MTIHEALFEFEQKFGKDKSLSPLSLSERIVLEIFANWIRDKYVYSLERKESKHEC